MNRRFYLGLSPWLCFVMADRADGVGAGRAAVLALACSVVLVAVEIRGRRPYALPLTGVGAFLADWVLSATRLWSPEVSRYDRTVVMLALAACIGSSLTGTPLTERYNRACMARRHAIQPSFRWYCRVTTRRWTVSTSCIAMSLAVGARWHSPMVGTVANWLVPLLLVALAASGPPAPLPSLEDETSAFDALSGALLGPVGRRRFTPRLVEPVNDPAPGERLPGRPGSSVGRSRHLEARSP